MCPEAPWPNSTYLSQCLSRNTLFLLSSLGLPFQDVFKNRLFYLYTYESFTVSSMCCSILCFSRKEASVVMLSISYSRINCYCTTFWLQRSSSGANTESSLGDQKWTSMPKYLCQVVSTARTPYIYQCFWTVCDGRVTADQYWSWIMVSRITAWGVQWTGLFHSAKTNRDGLIEDNLGRYCLKTFEMAKGKKERWCRRESNPGPLA